MNVAFDRDTDTSGTIPEVAKRFKARQQPWALVVDDNYGEGSAREHAALQPRFYGMKIRYMQRYPFADITTRLQHDPGKVVCTYT